jgi:flagellar assembly factor FliW
VAVTIKTDIYGEIELDEKQIFSFTDGILGFDYIKKFAFFDSDDENSPFKWLQAVDESHLAFATIIPVDVFGSYDLVISDTELEAVGTEDPNDLIVIAIVTIPQNPKEMTANLQGPIILNPKTGMGRQVISLSDKYTVKHIILEEMQKAAGSEG